MKSEPRIFKLMIKNHNLIETFIIKGDIFSNDLQVEDIFKLTPKMLKQLREADKKYLLKPDTSINAGKIKGRILPTNPATDDIIYIATVFCNYNYFPEE